MEDQISAVLTGDISGSSTLNVSALRRLEKVLTMAFSALATDLPAARPGAFTVFRGDSWQFVVREAPLAVRAAVFFRAQLIDIGNEELKNRLQTSVAVGFGGIDFLPDRLSSAGGGTAYTVSGRKLDSIRRRQPGMGVAGLAEVGPSLDSLVGLIDALAAQWTALQARAISRALRGLNQAEIARSWEPRISQQAVHKHLRAAGWPAIGPALSWAEDVVDRYTLREKRMADEH